MTNGEKYTTAKERVEAFLRFCDSNKDDCVSCKLRNNSCEPRTCAFNWLDLDAPAEEPLPCPFCGGKCSTKFNLEDRLVVECDYCTYSTASYDDEMKAISAHNRVARAVSKVAEMENAKIVFDVDLRKLAKEANDANA